MSKTTLAFEIGTEELPAFDLHAATEQLPSLVANALGSVRVPFDDVKVYSSPRRLVAIVEGVPERTEASVEEFRGPAARIAFDAEGNPTKAAAGFARGKGVDVADLERRDEDGAEYVYAVKNTPSADVAELLPETLKGVIEGISWPKSCRWGTTSEYFSRPVRWIVALLGDKVIPVRFAGLEAGNKTCGHRFLAPGPHTVEHADNLIDVLRGAYVVTSEAEREASVRKQVRAAEEKTGLTAELPAKTLAEVVNLSEYPTVMVGEFDELFLTVPKEIIVDAMLVHQRYFPLFNADGTLANKFLITSNGNPEFECNIVDGNQRVVAARLYDAKFFYDEDLKKPLEAYVDDLDAVVFQEKLGTTLAKSKRIVKLADHLCESMEIGGQEKEDILRAAHLCKADLVTGAVVEFTSVQGIMGSYYAKAAGETDAVSQAIADHYRPRFSGDNPPATRVGKVVAVADKLDTICGLFAVDQAPPVLPTRSPCAVARSVSSPCFARATTSSSTLCPPSTPPWPPMLPTASNSTRTPFVNRSSSSSLRAPRSWSVTTVFPPTRSMPFWRRAFASLSSSQSESSRSSVLVAKTPTRSTTWRLPMGVRTICATPSSVLTTTNLCCARSNTP